MKTHWFLTAAVLLTATRLGAAPASPATLALGAPAPGFELPGVDGRTYALTDFATAKVLVVIFTCNHCPTAQYYEERIKALVSDYRDKAVAVVAISPNDPKSVRLDELGYSDLGDSFPEMKLRARDRQFNFPYLYDGENEAVSRAYGPVATPHAFIFDAARRLRYVGRIDDSERAPQVKVHDARLAIDALLRDQEPPVTKTRAVGCSVKWAGKGAAVQAYQDTLAAEPVGLDLADAQTLKTLRENKSAKFRLVTFWATWCAPCVAEFHEFVTMNRMYRRRDFELVTVSINRPEERERVLAFLKKEQASHKNLLFASAEREALMDAFDPEWSGEVPFTVLIAPGGKILCREAGSIDPLALRRRVVQALNEKQPW